MNNGVYKKGEEKMVQYTTSIKRSSNFVKPFTAQQSKELSCIHLTHQLQLFICLRGQKQIENRDYNSNTQALFYTWFLYRLIRTQLAVTFVSSDHFWSDFKERVSDFMTAYITYFKFYTLNLNVYKLNNNIQIIT